MNRDSLVSRIVLTIILYGALLWQTHRYSSGAIFYGEYLHWTGLQATWLLLVALAVTPLIRGFPAVGWIRWLAARRRDVGIAVFGYALAHTMAYLFRQPDLQAILEDSLSAGILTGWLALLIFLPLALSSNDRSVRALGRRWRSLHKLVYAGALLTLAHWILTAFSPTIAYLHLVLLLALLAFRVVRLP